MAKDKKAFVLYADQKEVFNELPDAYAGKLIKHIFAYVTDQDPTTDDLILKIAFSSIKAQLKRDLKKYEAKSLVRSEAGRLGGIASGEARRSNPKQNEAIGLNTKQTEQDTVIVIDKDIVIDKEKGKSKVDNSAREFYKKEFKEGEGHKLYEKYCFIIGYIFNSDKYQNIIEERADHILKLKKQLEFKQYCKLYPEALKRGVSIKDLLDSWMNKPEYSKGKVSVYATLLKWTQKEPIKGTNFPESKAPLIPGASIGKKI